MKSLHETFCFFFLCSRERAKLALNSFIFFFLGREPMPRLLPNFHLIARTVHQRTIWTKRSAEPFLKTNLFILRCISITSSRYICRFVALSFTPYSMFRICRSCFKSVLTLPLRWEFIKENKNSTKKVIKEKRKFFLFLLIAFLVEFLFSYFLVFLYKFPPLVKSFYVKIQGKTK